MGILSTLGGPRPASTPVGAATQITTTELPTEFKPFITDIFEKAKAQQQGLEYTPYPGARLAPFGPLQEEAFEGLTGLARQGIAGAPDTSSAFYAQEALEAARRAGRPIETADIERLTNPYQQQVTDIAKREAERAYERNVAPQIEQQAVAAGSYGGSRAAMLESTSLDNLQRQLSDIQMKGSFDAYQQAQKAYEQEAGRAAGLRGFMQQQMQGVPAQALTELGTLQSVGETQQLLDQKALNLGYEDFLSEREFPTRSLQEYQATVRGFPYTPSAYQYTQQTTPTPSLGYSLMQAGTKALGGLGTLAGFAYGAPQQKAASGGQIRGGISGLVESHQNNLDTKPMWYLDDEETYREKMYDPASIPLNRSRLPAVGRKNLPYLDQVYENLPASPFKDHLFNIKKTDPAKYNRILNALFVDMRKQQSLLRPYGQMKSDADRTLQRPLRGAHLVPNLDELEGRPWTLGATREVPSLTNFLTFKGENLEKISPKKIQELLQRQQGVHTIPRGTWGSSTEFTSTSPYRGAALQAELSPLTTFIDKNIRGGEGHISTTPTAQRKARIRSSFKKVGEPEPGSRRWPRTASPEELAGTPVDAYAFLQHAEDAGMTQGEIEQYLMEGDINLTPTTLAQLNIRRLEALEGMEEKYGSAKPISDKELAKAKALREASGLTAQQRQFREDNPEFASILFPSEFRAQEELRLEELLTGIRDAQQKQETSARQLIGKEGAAYKAYQAGLGAELEAQRARQLRKKHLEDREAMQAERYTTERERLVEGHEELEELNRQAVRNREKMREERQEEFEDEQRGFTGERIGRIGRGFASIKEISPEEAALSRTDPLIAFSLMLGKISDSVANVDLSAVNKEQRQSIKNNLIAKNEDMLKMEQIQKAVITGNLSNLTQLSEYDTLYDSALLERETALVNVIEGIGKSKAEQQKLHAAWKASVAQVDQLEYTNAATLLELEAKQRENLTNNQIKLMGTWADVLIERDKTAQKKANILHRIAIEHTHMILDALNDDWAINKNTKGNWIWKATGDPVPLDQSDLISDAVTSAISRINAGEPINEVGAALQSTLNQYGQQKIIGVNVAIVEEVPQ